MNNEQTTTSQHHDLLSLFLEGYTSMCAHMDPACQKGLRASASLAFTKWFYTAAASETLLTPANILGQELNAAEGVTEYQYTLRLTTQEDGSEGYGFQLLSYSLNTHPFLEDLRKIADFCVPDSKMDETLFFLAEDREVLLKQLAHENEFYLEYLTRIAWRLGLFTYLPAIHTKKVQRAAYCNDFFAQGNQEQLLAVAEAACELAAERFSISMELEHGVATPSFFKECMTAPTETDRIFVEFYKQVDIDIEEIWQAAPGDLTEEDKAVISSFLFTGIMLDKWFIFPMSSFLGLLRPISFTPISYFHLVNNLASLLIMEHNIGAELFTPPSYYSLSPLGKALWGNFTAEDEKYKMPKKLPFEEIMQALLRETELNRFEHVFYMGPEKDILAIQVFLKEDPEFWKLVEIPIDTPLDDFCRDICAAFSMDEVEEYLLSIPDENNFPVEYSPIGSKRSVNKTADKRLGDLWLDKGTVFTLTFEKTTQIILEITEVSVGNPYILYPRVKKQSPKVTALEKIEEIF